MAALAESSFVLGIAALVTASYAPIAERSLGAITPHRQGLLVVRPTDTTLP